MTYYLIDFENVKSDGLKNQKEITDNDAIVIFYSENCKNISLDVLSSITCTNTKFSAIKVGVGGKNALDFQLSSYLGFLIGTQTKDTNYVIVSDDTGFDHVKKFWAEKGYKVERRALKKSTQKTASSTTSKKTSTKSKVAAADMATLDEVLQYISKNDEPELILSIINQYKTKTSINNAIGKELKDTKRGGAIYKKLKPLFKAKNKT